MAPGQNGLQVGPLASTVEVVAFVALTGATWFNGAELVWTIFVSFKRWQGKYFFSLLAATLGVLLYQLNVFFMIFTTNLNMHAIVACIGIGWSFMVTGQSLVLWSRLNLVCRSPWKLKFILYMIITDAVFLHIPQLAFSLAGIKNGTEDPSYRPFEIMEKIAIAIFTFQELLISSVYLMETVRILQVVELVQKKSNRRKIQMLFLANIAIISIDIITVTLEFLALWGVWCGFKGFGYSVKLKIEFAILNQLRDSVKPSASMGGYGHDHSSKSIHLSSRGPNDRKSKKYAKPPQFAFERQTFEEIEDNDQIRKTVEISVQHDGHATTPKQSAFGLTGPPAATPSVNRHGIPTNPPSEASSEIEFATEGV